MSSPTQESVKNITFSEKNGCFLSKCKIIIILLGFLIFIFATGLLTYYFTSSRDLSRDKCEVISHATGKMETGIKTPQASNSPQSDHHHHHHCIPKANATNKGIKKQTLDIRLPRSIKPLHYHVKLLPFLYGNFSIHGHLSMEFEVLKDTRNVTLHMVGIKTHNDTIKLTSAKKNASIPIQKHTYDKNRQFYVALLNQELKVGLKYVISMDFTGLLNKDRNGFYRSNYVDESGNMRWIAATQFQATRARKAFPCLDEPGLKATFTIEIARIKNMTSISNMPIDESFPMQGHPDWVWDKFKTSVPMSTYLVAFVVSDFKSIQSKHNSSYDFKVWARESALYQADFALNIGLQATKFFEEFFRIPYPLPKQDMIALPEKGYGAMENWGLITYGELAMLFDPETSKASNKEYVAIGVVHELAHQWFGNIVTPSWWTDLWLNEGFASYMEYIGLNAVEPSFKMIEQFVIKALHPAFSLDSFESSHPISVQVQHPNQISEIFDKISYEKGSAIIRMMHLFLGDKTFREGLSSYLKGLEYSIAEQDDLWRYLTEQATIDSSLSRDMTVKAIMDTWTLQMGYPVITVTTNKDGTALLKQERFLLEKDPHSTDTHDYKWWVPITFTSKSEHNFNTTKPRMWMSPNDTTMVINGVPNDEWVVFNILQAGYYRVNYDKKNWNAIIDQLLLDHTIISSINRAQILNDALALSRAGMLAYETSLKILSYLQNEENFVPWKAALNEVEFLHNMFASTGGFGALKSFLLELLTPLYNKIGFADRITDPHLEQIKRAEILQKVCNFGYQMCVREAVSLFKKWMISPDNNKIISPNVRDVVYCTAIKNGGFEEWKFAWNKFLKANVDSEKETILSALGCTKETWLLTSYLQKILQLEENSLRIKDVYTVFSSVASSEHGSAEAWHFLKNNYDKIYKNIGSNIVALYDIVKLVSKRFQTPNQFKELKVFIKTTEESYSPAELSVKQILENVGNNLKWMNNHYRTILNWLSENGYEDKII